MRQSVPRLRALSILLLHSLTIQPSYNPHALILYDDGNTHTITESINDAIHLRSSSSLLFPDRYTIRPPSGSECAVRLYMTSLLNMTAGEIDGGDLDDEESQDLEGVGVMVGGASAAWFYDGATVRGGNRADAISGAVTHFDIPSASPSPPGKGGDSIVGQYFGSVITIHGGNFIGGRGSSTGHSLHVAYDARAQVYGGSFRGSWLVRDGGAIVVHGCVSKVGNHLVGHLENGDEVNVQIVEENGGRVVVDEPGGGWAGACNMYDGSKSSAEDSGVRLDIWSLILSLLFARVIQ